MSSPIVQISSVGKETISDELNANVCNVTFYPDQNLTEWEARAGGTGPGTGILVDSGGAINASEHVSFEVTYDELTEGEKTYRINVYGKNSLGEWTTYG